VLLLLAAATQAYEDSCPTLTRRALPVGGTLPPKEFARVRLQGRAALRIFFCGLALAQPPQLVDDGRAQWRATTREERATSTSQASGTTWWPPRRRAALKLAVEIDRGSIELTVPARNGHHSNAKTERVRYSHT